MDTNHNPQADLQAELAKLRAENEALKRKAEFDGALIKISPKGAVSVYGFGRWPVTLYKSQWEKLFTQIPEIQAFVEKHRDRLKDKDSESESPQLAAI